MPQLLIIVGVIVFLAAAIVLALIPHNLRVRRCRRAYAALPQEMRDRAIQLISDAGRRGAAGAVLLRISDTRNTQESADIDRAHIGGIPYAEEGEAWPKASPAPANRDAPPPMPATFLLQARLSAPDLGDAWIGKLATVFLATDYWEVIVRTYDAPTAQRFSPMAGGPDSAVPFRALEELRLPLRIGFDEADESDPAGLAERLLEEVPGLRESLIPFHKDTEGLLSQILSPGVYGYNLEAPEIIFQGGLPELIQNPHDATCGKCGQPMRFLFQFGDVIPGIVLGDAGVCYVYGCDAHPTGAQAFVDSH